MAMTRLTAAITITAAAIGLHWLGVDPTTGFGFWVMAALAVACVYVGAKREAKERAEEAARDAKRPMTALNPYPLPWPTKPLPTFASTPVRPALKESDYSWHRKENQ